MKVTITPRGRSAYTVDTDPDTSPTWRSSEDLGWQDATIPLASPLSQTRLAWIRDAEVILHGPYGDLYRGFVKSAESTSMTCGGWLVSVLDSTPREGVYCDTTFSPWFTNPAAESNISCGYDLLGLTCTFSDGTAYGTNAWNGSMRYVPKNSSMRITFDWVKPFAASSVRVLASPRDDTKADGASSWTTVATVATGGSGTLSGSASVDISITDCELIMIQYVVTSPTTPAGDKLVTIRNLKVFASGITTVNPTTVINDCLSKVSEIVYTDIATDSTTLEPFVQAGSERDRIQAVRTYVGGVFRAEPREGLTSPVAVFKTRPTTAAYTFTEDGVTCVCDSLKMGAELDSLYSAVRVTYTDDAGRSRYVDCYDTDTDHYLVQIGRYHGGTYGAKWASELSVDTTSATLAASAGALYLTMVGADSVNGTVSVIDEKAGYILPGELAQITTRDHGTVTARIREVYCSGYGAATLTLDNTETAADLVARAVERAKRGL